MRRSELLQAGDCQVGIDTLIASIIVGNEVCFVYYYFLFLFLLESPWLGHVSRIRATGIMGRFLQPDAVTLGVTVMHLLHGCCEPVDHTLQWQVSTTNHNPEL